MKPIIPFLRSKFLIDSQLDKSGRDPLSTDEIYLLLVLIENYWKKPALALPVKEISKRLQIGETSFSKAVSRLVAKGLIKVSPSYSDDRRGRPINRYAFSKELSEQLIAIGQNDDGIAIKNTSQILGLNSIKANSAKKRDKLRRRDIVILCILIAHSDLTGIVKTLTPYELGELTASKPNETMKSIKNLILAKEIVTYIPGFYSKLTNLFETGIFQLNKRYLSRIVGLHEVLRWQIINDEKYTSSQLLYRQLRITVKSAADSSTTTTTNYATLLWGNANAPRDAAKRVFFSIAEAATMASINVLMEQEHIRPLPAKKRDNEWKAKTSPSNPIKEHIPEDIVDSFASKITPTNSEQDFLTALSSEILYEIISVASNFLPGLARTPKLLEHLKNYDVLSYNTMPHLNNIDTTLHVAIKSH